MTDTTEPTTTIDLTDTALQGVNLVERHFDDEDLARLAEHDHRVVLGIDPRHPGSRYRTCARKTTYGESAAHTAARKLRDAKAEDVHAYPCPYCCRWHVGHKAALMSHHLDHAI